MSVPPSGVELTKRNHPERRFACYGKSSKVCGNCAFWAGKRFLTNRDYIVEVHNEIARCNCGHSFSDGKNKKHSDRCKDYERMAELR